MCQFCHEHGDGKKWYLQAENYSAELLNNLERRRFIDGFLEKYGNWEGAKVEKDFQRGPDDAHFDRLTKEEALDLLGNFEKQGLIHTIWTFKTPFIGGICNCDRADCLALLSYRYDFKAFFRAEYVAGVSPDACTGCRECHSLCQFGAIGFSVMDQKTFIDPLRCYGCGICRSACEMEAISLTPRNEHPLASKLW